MFCKNCGNQIIERVSFCQRGGTKVSNDEIKQTSYSINRIENTRKKSKRKFIL